MKKNFLILLSFICVIGLLWSCKKDLAHVDAVSTTEGYVSFIKIIHAAPSFRQVFNASDSFNVYFNGPKVNGVFLTYNSVFPTITNLYSAITAGPQSIRLTVNGKTLLDSTVTTISKNLVPGSYYSFIITDSALNSNESKQMWLKDDFALTDTNNYNIRFVDAVMNDPVLVDVYSYRRATNIFSNIKPTNATQFVTVPYTLQSDTLYVRVAGTQTEITRLPIVAGSTTALNRTRAYTLLYKGLNGGTGTKARTLSLYAND